MLSFFDKLFHKKKPELPQINHLAIIMDGNRRWAKKKNLVTKYGHRQGAEKVKELMEFCVEHKIKIVSAYTFSLENFNRDQDEINELFSMLLEESEKALPELIKHEIKVLFIGDKSYFPTHLIDTINKLEFATHRFSSLIFNVLFCYGGRQEIIHAARLIAEDARLGTLKNEINEELFQKYLWTGNQPDPDIIIRTGGVIRLSNFLLYKAAYSELYFLDKLWPDLTKKDLEKILLDFKKRKRNFGY